MLPNKDRCMQQAFLEDIRDSPDDDAPRLIYADWLDDHGQHERAELIRIQCELAQLEVPLNDLAITRDPFGNETRRAVLFGKDGRFYSSRKAESLCAREAELLSRWAPLWSGWPTKRYHGLLLSRNDEEEQFGSPYFWRRGFVHTVRCPLRMWLGEPCEICSSLESAMPSGSSLSRRAECLHCNGTGWSGGCAMVKSNPVSKVTMGGLEPLVIGHEPLVIGHQQQEIPWGIGWVAADNPSQSGAIPLCLFRFLPPPPKSELVNFGNPLLVTAFLYRDRKKALEALSIAAILYAYSLVPTTEMP